MLFESTPTEFLKPASVARASAPSRSIEICGYPTNSTQIAGREKYVVSIYSKIMNVMVKALMQDKVSLYVSGRWEPYMSIEHWGGILEKLTQFAGGVSFLRPWMTTRMWRGTSPIAMELNLKFEAIDDAYANVFRPCTVLTEMALPYWFRESMNLPKSRILGDMLSPPGPSAFKDFPGYKTLRGILSFKEYEQHQGDTISIKIGDMFRFDNVIIVEVASEYEPKFTPTGRPVTASIRLRFETYTIMDRQNFRYSTYEREETYSPRKARQEASSS